MIIPVAAKIILRPAFGFLDLNEQTSKGIQGIIIIGIMLGTYKIFYKKNGTAGSQRVSRKAFFSG